MIDYDMHIHTVASDGVLTPEEVFEIAKQKGLKGLSITDHDTVKALEICESLAVTYNLDFIPGIELSTEYKGQEIHILGYYVDYENEEFKTILNNFQTERVDRIHKMLKRVNELGFKVTFEDIIEEAGNEALNSSFGRPHLARVLIKKGYFKSMNEVFDNLLGNGKPGCVERFKYDTLEGIKMIATFGGIPIIAHPGLLKMEYSKLELLIGSFVEVGLKGIEVYHTDHPEEISYMLTKIANKYRILKTGGSDYHGPSPARQLSIGAKGVTQFDVEKLKQAKINY